MKNDPMTEETSRKIDTFCEVQSSCETCPIYLNFRILKPYYPCELSGIRETTSIEIIPEMEQIVLSIIEREESKNART